MNNIEIKKENEDVNINSFKRHFRQELEILRKNLSENDALCIQDFIPKIEEITDIFANQGHSGSSAPFYIGALTSAIKNVLSFKPLSPLTGEEWEWGGNNMDGKTLQNKRLSALFKDTEINKAYYLDAIVWQGEDEWDTFSGTIEGISSRQYVQFPFVPKTFKINVYRERYDENNPKHKKSRDVVSCGSGDYVYFIKDKNQLKEVAEYYDGLNTNKNLK